MNTMLMNFNSVEPAEGTLWNEIEYNPTCKLHSLKVQRYMVIRNQKYVLYNN